MVVTGTLISFMVGGHRYPENGRYCWLWLDRACTNARPQGYQVRCNGGPLKFLNIYTFKIK